MSIEELLKIKVDSYIEHFIINLDLSDSTKNILKEQLKRHFLDEDLIYDLKNSENELKSQLEENKKLQTDIEIKDKVIEKTCKYINEAKIMNKAIPVYPNKKDTPYTVGVASIEEIKQYFYKKVEEENVKN